MKPLRRQPLSLLTISAHKLQADAETLLSPYPAAATHGLVLRDLVRQPALLISPWPLPLNDNAPLPCIALEEGLTSADTITAIRDLRLHNDPTPHLDTYCSTLREAGLPDFQIGQVLGLERSVVSRWISLHTADAHLRDLVRQGRVTLGHARLLFALPHPDQHRWADLIEDERLSIQQLRQLLKQDDPQEGAVHDAGETPAANATTPTPDHAEETTDSAVEALSASLSERLSCPVQINWSRSGADRTLTMKAWGIESLHGILEALLQHQPDTADKSTYTLTFSNITTDSLHHLVGHLSDL